MSLSQAASMSARFSSSSSTSVGTLDSDSVSEAWDPVVCVSGSLVSPVEGTETDVVGRGLSANSFEAPLEQDVTSIAIAIEIAVAPTAPGILLKCRKRGKLPRGGEVHDRGARPFNRSETTS